MSDRKSYGWLSCYPGRAKVRKLGGTRDLVYTLGKGVFRRCVVCYPARGAFLVACLLLTACATAPATVASLPDTVTTADLEKMQSPTVLFGHEVDTANDAVLVCRWFPREGSLLCLPYSEEIEQ